MRSPPLRASLSASTTPPRQLSKEVHAMAAAPQSADGSKGGGFIGGIDQRFPLTKMWKEHVAEYYAPKNFNFWYYFGSLALLILANQVVTGIFLTMNYKPSSAEAFSSVEYIMRDEIGRASCR